MSVGIFIFVIIAGLCLLSYMVYLAFHDVTTYELLSHPKIPSEFDQYIFYFITDIHRRKIKSKTLEKIKEPIDLVLIGGDLVERGVPLERMKANLQKLKRWNVPIYFVWGNNDILADVAEMKGILADENVIVLEDDIVEITRGKASINLIGLNYDRDITRKPKLSSREISTDFTLLLTHTPGSFYRLIDDIKQKIDTALAGHTHGGQIRFFSFGLDVKGGYYRVGGASLFISEGYGYRLIPFRLQTRAVSHVFTLKAN